MERRTRVPSNNLKQWPIIENQSFHSCCHVRVSLLRICFHSNHSNLLMILIKGSWGNLVLSMSLLKTQLRSSIISFSTMLKEPTSGITFSFSTTCSVLLGDIPNIMVTRQADFQPCPILLNIAKTKTIPVHQFQPVMDLGVGWSGPFGTLC